MRENTKNTNTAKSIINVAINGMPINKVVDITRTRLESVEKSAFNIALLTAYGTGTTIPEHTDSKGNIHGEATCEKPLKQNEFTKLVGRAESTLSRWLKAFNLIIENGYFTDFAQGKYPFSFDKIIYIFSDSGKIAFKGMVFADIMALSAATIKTMVKSVQPEQEEPEQEEQEEPEQEEQDFGVITFKGIDYKVPAQALAVFLAEYGTIIE